VHRLYFLPACIAALAFGLAACGGSGAAGADSELAFVTSRDGDYAIYGMRADGSGQGRLTEGGGGGGTSSRDVFFQFEPAWSPDGSRIAFTSRRDGRSHIYVMSADGSGTKRITSGPHQDAVPAWSPDGRLIAFSRDHLLYVVTPSGDQLRRVTDSLGGEETDPAWSPDGSSLAYVRRLPGYISTEIWRVRADGTGARRLTRLNGTSAGPAWSPDGHRIVFVNNANDARYQVYEISGGGKGLRRLTFQQGNYFDPSWSPDGTKLIVERDGLIYVRDASGVETAITDGPNDGNPAWRPVQPKQSGY